MEVHDGGKRGGGVERGCERRGFARTFRHVLERLRVPGLNKPLHFLAFQRRRRFSLPQVSRRVVGKDSNPLSPLSSSPRVHRERARARAEPPSSSSCTGECVVRSPSYSLFARSSGIASEQTSVGYRRWRRPRRHPLEIGRFRRGTRGEGRTRRSSIAGIIWGGREGVGWGRRLRAARITRGSRFLRTHNTYGASPSPPLANKEGNLGNGNARSSSVLTFPDESCRRFKLFRQPAYRNTSKTCLTSLGTS